MVSVKDKIVSPERTICEVHREIHDLLLEGSINQKLTNELIDLLETAYRMGKKMDGKLRQYKHNYDDNWWKKTRDEILVEKLGRRKNRQMTFISKDDNSPLIRYFDIAPSFDGLELEIFLDKIFPKLDIKNVEVYAFEPCSESFEKVSSKFREYDNVNFYNLAIWNKEDTMKLYHSPENPHGNSLYDSKNNICKETFEIVKCISFSRWLSENITDLDRSFNILRYNIEGSELELFRDMDSHDLFKYFHVITGAGDEDLKKCSELTDKIEEFHFLCKKNNIFSPDFRPENWMLVDNLIQKEFFDWKNENFKQKIKTKSIENKLKYAFIVGGDKKYMDMVETCVKSLNKYSKIPVVVYGFNCKVPFSYPNMVSTPNNQPKIDYVSKYGKDTSLLYAKHEACLLALDEYDYDYYIWLDGDCIVAQNIDSLLNYTYLVDKYPLCMRYPHDNLIHWRMINDSKKEAGHGDEAADIIGSKRNNNFTVAAGLFMFNKDSKPFFEEVLETNKKLIKIDNTEFADEGALNEGRLVNALFWKYNYKKHMPISWISRDESHDYLIPKIERINKKFDIMYIYEDSPSEFTDNQEKILFYHGHRTKNDGEELLKEFEANKLMIVSHPDDESIFAGGTLLNENGWKVVCVTCNYDNIRREEFKRAMKFAGVEQYEIWDFLCGSVKFDEEKIKLLLKRLLKEKTWEKIVSHNYKGEYGHFQHKELHKIIHNLIGDSFYMFEASDSKINNNLYRTKLELLKIYKSQVPLLPQCDIYISNEKMVRKKEKIKLGEFERHTSDTMSEMIWYETPKSDLKWPYYGYEKLFDNKDLDVERLKSRPTNIIESDFNSKKILRREETRDWICGINLKTFVELNGVYPHRNDIIEKLKAKDIHGDYKWDNSNNDLIIHNFILSGCTLHMIDFDDKLIEEEIFNDQLQLDIVINKLKKIQDDKSEENKIKLNLGCGTIIRSGYINIDKYNNTDQVDLKADLGDLPFDNGSVDEIYVSHVFEHIGLPDIYSVMNEWKRVLRVGGKLVLRLPNLEHEVKIWLNAPDDRKWFEVHRIYGSQSHEGNTHLNGHTPASLKLFIESLNFNVVSCELGDRGYGEEIQCTAIRNQDKIQHPVTYNCHFVDGPFIEITGHVDDKNYYQVDFLDPDNNAHIHHELLKINYWTRPYRRWFTNWDIQVHRNGKLDFTHKFNAEGKRILISFDTKSLGDTLAWIPYMEEFRKKHKCELYVSTFWNRLFEPQKEYKTLHFVTPGAVVNDLYASYSVGCYDGNINKNKTNWRIVPLQQICTDCLGLEYKEIIPAMNLQVNRGRKIKDKYVCISEFSTFQCKFWNYPNGWQKIVNYLNEMDYKVVVISKEKTKLKNIIDRTNRTIHETINTIRHADFFMGVSAGPSWLAWALHKPVIMISGYSAEYGEFKSNIERIINKDVCHGCFNETDNVFDRGNWNWCPHHENTSRQFECTKKITPERVIDSINNIERKLISAIK